MKKIFISCLILFYFISFKYSSAAPTATQETNCSNSNPNYTCERCNDNSCTFSHQTCNNISCGGSPFKCCETCGLGDWSGYSCMENMNPIPNTHTCSSRYLCSSGDGTKCCKLKTATTEPPEQTPAQTPAQTEEPEQTHNERVFIFTGISTECKDHGNCETTDLVKIAMNAANLLLGLIAGVALLFFVIAGIQMIISQGNAEKISSAKSMMLNSVIGIAIAMCSFVIVRFVQSALGLTEIGSKIIK